MISSSQDEQRIMLEKLRWQMDRNRIFTKIEDYFWRISKKPTYTLWLCVSSTLRPPRVLLYIIINSSCSYPPIIILLNCAATAQRSPKLNQNSIVLCTESDGDIMARKLSSKGGEWPERLRCLFIFSLINLFKLQTRKRRWLWAEWNQWARMTSKCTSTKIMARVDIGVPRSCFSSCSPSLLDWWGWL